MKSADLVTWMHGFCPGFNHKTCPVLIGRHLQITLLLGASSSLKEETHPHHHPFSVLPSGRPLTNSFDPRAIIELNSTKRCPPPPPPSTNQCFPPLTGQTVPMPSGQTTDPVSTFPRGQK
ncbi:hypothetical protein JOQ06_027108 [Pogonophryne albipinna]|uniref:Uncharacterized protein n=1 Tax=Pogonophryne albipinna TaxID=1090488 RepID=A0AAD6B9X5_9TELE|nr:hypothetical protein JOQ06_027108 [Pogonophryne albipinna]